MTHDDDDEEEKGQNSSREKKILLFVWFCWFFNVTTLQKKLQISRAGRFNNQQIFIPFEWKYDQEGIRVTARLLKNSYWQYSIVSLKLAV